MMGGFVHQQPAAVALLSMPAPKIIRAVTGVQHPGEVHTQRLPDYALHEQFAQSGVSGRITVVESDAQRFSRSLDAFINGAQLLKINSHRLFGDDIAAQFHRPDNVLVMRAIYRRHNHDIWPGLGDHAVKIVGMIGWSRRQTGQPLQMLVVPGHPHLAQVA